MDKISWIFRTILHCHLLSIKIKFMIRNKDNIFNAFNAELTLWKHPWISPIMTVKPKHKINCYTAEMQLRVSSGCKNCRDVFTKSDKQIIKRLCWEILLYYCWRRNKLIPVQQSRRYFIVIEKLSLRELRLEKNHMWSFRMS